MIRFNHKHNHDRKFYLYRVLFYLLTVAILVMFLPREGVTKYHYHLGEPWDDGSLIAQDSFPIFKSEDVIRREVDSLHRYYEPYFFIDTESFVQVSELLDEKFRSLPPKSVPYYYLSHVKEKLSYVYRQGIMSADDYSTLSNEETEMVRVFRQNESQNRSMGSIFTEKSAYEYMMSESDSARYSHKTLSYLNLVEFIHPNLVYDYEKSMQQRREVDGMLVPYMGQVMAGQKIVDRGQIVDEVTFNILRSLERHNQERDISNKEKVVLLAGQVLFIGIFVGLLLMYFEQFRRDYLESVRTVLLVISLLLFFPLVTYGLVSHSFMSVYAVPYCIAPLLIRIFMDSRSAFTTHVFIIIICSVALSRPYEFIVTETVAGLVAIYSLRQLSERSELFRTAVLVILSTLVTYFCIDVLKGRFMNGEMQDTWTYIYLTIAGVLSLLAYLLLIPIERVFGFTSVVTLVELSNINHPVLRRLSEEAPGTFQHSMQVANLAAEVANRLGGESQLVRTGALYHDIGKLENPAFFTENQSSINPHNAITNIQSAQIIIQHVRDGLKLADKYKLPPIIKEFISTHHGKSMVKYFYISYKNAFPNSQVDESLFTYPGPAPHTMEQAILMMADSIEAASRSLKEYTEENINGMVDRIISGQVDAGYFNQCPITFLDLEDAKEVFKSKLRTMYHTRIQYPELK